MKVENLKGIQKTGTSVGEVLEQLQTQWEEVGTSSDQSPAQNSVEKPDQKREYRTYLGGTTSGIEERFSF